MKITPRPYQEEATTKFYKALEKGIRRQMFVQATGTGKTLSSCFLIDDFVKQGKRILVLVERKVLAKQWKDAILSYSPNISVGIEMNVNKSQKKNDVVIASLQTLGRKNSKRIKKFDPNEFDFCIGDEAHLFPTPQGIRVLEYFQFGHDSFADKNVSLLLTATPKRSDGVSLGYLCDDITAEYMIPDAIADGWLTDIVVERVKTGTDISNVPKYKDDYNIKQLSKAVNVDTRNQLILKAYFEHLKGESALVFSADVEHAYTLKELFNAHNVSAQVIEANTDEEDRKRWIEEFLAGELDLLINFNTLGIGFNSPMIKGIMLCRPVRSPSLLTQILGRSLRPPDDAFVDAFKTAVERRNSIANSTKPFAKIIDFDDTVNEGNILTEASLFGCSPNLDISGKKLFKEVVEPLEKLKKEKGVDIAKIEDLSQIELISERKKLDITSLRTPPEIEELSNRTWVGAGKDTYEILYGDEKKALIVEKDTTKEEMLSKEEWVLFEHDTKDNVTKRLQSFYNLSAAIKNADEYAERNGWDTQFKEKKEWMGRGISEGQWNFLMNLYRYKNGYCEFSILSSRYPDTGMRKLQHKKTKEVLDSGLASQYIQQKIGK